MPCDSFKQCLGDSECKTTPADKDCLEIIHSLKSLKDPHSKSIYQFDPEGNDVLLYHIDEHVITQITDEKACKCDFLLVLDKDAIKSLVFVELKGKNVDHAIEQISKTIEKLEPYFYRNNPKYYARIVCKKTAPSRRNDPKVEALRKILIRLNGKYNQNFYNCSTLKKVEKYTSFANAN